MKKAPIILSAVLMLSQTAVYAYDYPQSFWSLNDSYTAAKERLDYDSMINYGEKIISLLQNEEKNESVVTTITSKEYDLAPIYESRGNYDRALLFYEDYVKNAHMITLYDTADNLKIANAAILQYKTAFDLYTKTSVSQSDNEAVNEPEKGVLIGQTSDSKMKNANESMILLYQNYGETIQPWVTHILKTASENNRAVELALNFPNEGSQLDSIINDKEFISSLTDTLKKYPDVPVYLRIGAEFNIWNDKAEPSKFIQAFRKVSSEVKAELSNVASVWSASHTSSWDINAHDYYPGDEYVDWVGISTYSNKYFGGKTWDINSRFNEVVFKSGNSADPVYLIKEYVDRYGQKKPIMLAESGASHYTRSSSIQEDTTEWADVNLRKIYRYIPMVYPQVKLIAYFNKDIPQELNAYALDDNETLAKTYNSMLTLPQFIKSDFKNKPEFIYRKIDGQITAKDELDLYSYVHVFGNDEPRVDYYIDDVYAGGSQTLPYSVSLDLSGYKSGNHKLKAVVTSNGTQKTEKIYDLNIDPDLIKIEANGKRLFPDVEPFIKDERTLVPVRLVSDALGCDISWDQQAQTATIKNDSKTIKMALDSKIITVNGENLETDVPVTMADDRLFIPIRAAAEALDANVEWDNDERCVIIELQ